MTKFAPFLICVFLYGSPTTSLASGNDLLRYCSGIVQAMDSGQAGDKFEHGYCLGLMQGITNTARIYGIAYGFERSLCLPKDGIENGQAARIVVNYLKAHPELLHEDESVLTFKALSASFPCPSSKGGL